MNIVDRVTQGCTVLAPLTKGGNLPFRRFCVEQFGAEVTISEMAYARYLVKGESRERALLRKHSSEKCFGVQLAALQVEEALLAAKMAQDMGADFIDINCGCPIDDVVRRGLGSALLRRPKALFRLVEHLAGSLDIPVTVKIRVGFKEGEENALEIARGVEAAGAKVLTIHGRTREQRYSRSANWSLIGEIAREVKIPVVGNGDILTWYEAQSRRELARVPSVMIARGALIKPWLFQEIREGRTLHFSALERLNLLLIFVSYLKEHFGDDEMGHKRIMKFLPWHLELFSRYEYLPEESYREASLQHPLLQSRLSSSTVPSDPVERVLCCSRPEIHQELALELIKPENEQALLESVCRMGERLLVEPQSVAEQGSREFRETAG